jgi:predicted RND superfamily exporter protein
MNRAMHGDASSYEVLPDTQEEIAQYLLLHSLSGDTRELNQVGDDEFQRINLLIRQKTLSSARIGTVLEELDRWGNKLSREKGLRLKTGGREKMLHVLVDVIVKGQIYSILLSMMGVMGITTLMFRSFRSGLLTILPIGIASLFNFAIMALARLPLEPSSAITACIGIGVGIDYAIHYISKYRHLAREAQPQEFAVRSASSVYERITVQSMGTAGKAIAFNALVVILGFLVLLFSNFPPTRTMGILVSLNMFTSFVGALTLLPAAVNRIRPRACSVAWAREDVPSILQPVPPRKAWAVPSPA